MGTRPQEGGKGPKGSVLRPTSAGPQVVDSLGLRWTDEAEARFLDELGASCNVSRSAELTGFNLSTLYRRKRSDPGFAERWQAALVQGFDRLETLLLQRATEALEGRMPDPEHPIPAMTVAEVIRILQMHRAEARGVGPKSHRRAPPRALDEMRRSIVAKLQAIETARRTADGEDPEGERGDG